MAVDPITAVIDLVRTGLNKFVRDKVDEGTLKSIELDFEKHVLTEARTENSDFRSFVISYEGEAKDYKDVRFFGPLILMVRGLIRPIFTLATAWWDWQFFASVAEWSEPKIQVLYSVNLIVLMFWFGERAIKNSGIIDTMAKLFTKSGGK
jgi:hypothetical protein